MDIQTKYRVTLLNAKCEYVCAVDTLVKKMNYGEDVDCCINKLFLASRLINRLDCYCFDSIPLGTETISSEFELTGSNNSYAIGTIGQLIINGIQVIGGESINPYTEKDGIATGLNAANIEYSVVSGGGTYTFSIKADPYVKSIKFIITSPSGEINILDPTLTVVGVPSVSECYNCISDSDLPKMYEVLGKLLS